MLLSTIADIEFGRQLGFFKSAFEKTPSAEDEKTSFNASGLMAVLSFLNESDEDGCGGYGTSGVRGEHVSATL